ncbi:hypothetical protein A7U60_g6399 [Sanghuangporus baumii]|uniref:DUF6533 domain-containing protein n=1 Tax=Sanghuangporus baumii TaxID=108892 RepID=A0A9Q5HV92_SANBA|nr:hypothetical protein A7U60_g6399 [Sanghuangporus baumii]
MLALRFDTQEMDPRRESTSAFQTSLFCVAFTTVLFYDIVIKVDQEVKYFWRYPLRPVSFLYFSTRFCGILGASSGILYSMNNEITPLCKIRMLCTAVHSNMDDYKVNLATGRPKCANAPCLPLSTATGRLALVVYEVKDANPIASRLNGDYVICLLQRVQDPGWNTATWIVLLLYGVILMALALYKTLKYWESVRQSTALLRVLIEDQMIYFSMTIICAVMNLIAGYLGHSAYLDNIVLGLPSLLSAIGAHMLIHLKEVGAKGTGEDASYRTHSLSAMEFA